MLVIAGGNKTLKKYELLCVIRPNLDMDDAEKVIKNIEDQIKNFGGSVLNIDKLGRKKLAYDVQRFRDGFVAVLSMDLPENKVVDLKRYLKLNEDVIREMITVQEKQKAASAK